MIVSAIVSPAEATYWIFPGWILFLAMHFLGVACFAWIVAKRFAPLRRAQRDFRFDRPWARLGRVVQYWLGQWRHPRYRFAGALHMLVFAGFLVLVMRAVWLLILGVSPGFAMPGMSGRAGHLYDIIRDYATTI